MWVKFGDMATLSKIKFKTNISNEFSNYRND